MAGQLGHAVLIKRDAGASTFVTIGGMRAKSIQINGQPADTSDSDSRWRELLAGAGLKSVSISGSGVFKDSAPENGIRTDIFADATATLQFIVPGLGTFQGTFICTSLSYQGGHTDEVQFSASWESSGEITFT